MAVIQEKASCYLLLFAVQKDVTDRIFAVHKDMTDRKCCIAGVTVRWKDAANVRSEVSEEGGAHP